MKSPTKANKSFDTVKMKTGKRKVETEKDALEIFGVDLGSVEKNGLKR